MAPMQWFVGDADAGEPEVETYSEYAACICAGTAVWDSRDRRFHFVDATDLTDRSWAVLIYSDGTPEAYEPGTRLVVAVRTADAVAFNAHRTGERAA